MYKQYQETQEEDSNLSPTYIESNADRFKPFIAIDFGSTNSTAYLFKPTGKEEGSEIPLADDVIHQDSTNFPSLVEYTEDLEGNKVVLTGYNVKDSLLKVNKASNKFVVKCVKRMIGLSYQEFKQLDNPAIFGCEVFEKNGRAYLRTGNTDKEGKSGVEVASEIFKRMKRTADKRNNNISVTDCYMTVPANFKDHQCNAIKQAASLAGLEVKAMYKEPIAAAMSWGCEHLKSLRALGLYEKMLVFNFGGCTLDVSVLCYEGDGKFQVLATDGNDHLGGSDVDGAIAAFILEKHQDSLPTTIRPGEKLYPFFLSLCEETKVSLTTEKEASIDLSRILEKSDGDDEEEEEKEKEIMLTEDDLASILHTSFEEKIMVCITNALQKAGNLGVGDITHVLMVGGSSHLQEVNEMIKQKFVQATLHPLNMDTCVAQGALKLAKYMLLGYNPCQEILRYSYGLMMNEDRITVFLSEGTIAPCQSKPIQFRKVTEDSTNTVRSRVFQLDGHHRNHVGRMIHYDSRTCTLIGNYSFDQPKSESTDSQSFTIQFKIEPGRILEVVTRDCDTNAVLHCQSFQHAISEMY